MSDKKINTLKQFLSATQVEKNNMFDQGAEKSLVKDIKNQLISKETDSIQLSLHLIRKLKLHETIPTLFKNVKVLNAADPMGSGIDPVSLIIELGDHNFNAIMDCVSEEPTDENIRMAAKILFHWFVKDPDKLEKITSERSKSNSKAEEAVLKQVKAELETYNKSK